MKKITLFIAISLFTITSFAQYNPSSPWMLELKSKSSKKEFTLKEISESFNAYWDKHQDLKNKKGSGYKPFKRWEQRWKNELNKSGNISKPSKLWQAWEEKKALQNKRSNVISNWANIGPFSELSNLGQGRINTIAVDPSNANTYYAGAPSGGLWKSIDAGASWLPIADNLPQIGVSGIAVDPNNSDIIYIATGDDDNSDSYSVGILKTVDGGLTWNTTGLQFTNSYTESNEIYIHPNNSNILWVATSVGLFKTINGGNTWVNNLNGNVSDLKIHPTNPDIIYVVKEGSFFKSTDGGDAFIQITAGLPASSYKVVIEVTPASPNMVFLLATSGTLQGLFKSTDSGISFNVTQETNNLVISGQVWYDLALTVSDTDENTIFIGVLDIWKSIDGGDSFTQLNNWADQTAVNYTHGDVHFLRYFNGDLFCGSDGGVYRSSNNGLVFDDLNKDLAIGQYYSIAVSKQSANNIAGGLQDNGGSGYSNGAWNHYHGGDGMDSVIDPNNQNTYYGFMQYGANLSVSFDGGLTGQSVANSPESGNWLTPLKINADSEIFAGYTKLYKLTNNSWQPTGQFVFPDAISQLEIDANNSDIIYASVYTTLYKSINKGVSFTEIFNANDEISSIAVNTLNSDLVYLTTSGFDNEIYKSTDGGTSFNSILGNLSTNEGKNIIIHQPHSLINDLYVGTSFGVYHINDNLSNWEVFSTNLPNVKVTDLNVNIIDRIITASTYGRGVWQSPVEVVLPDNDIRLVSIKDLNKSYLCDTQITPIITVKNEGLNTVANVNIDYIVNGTSYNYTYNGSILSETEQIITLPNVNGLNFGENQLSVTATIVNDAFSDNNTIQNSFYVNNSDQNPTVINNFNNSTDSWLVTSSNLWQIGTPTTNLLGATNSTGYVTNATSNYTTNTSSYLISPCYDLTTITHPIIKFDMAFDLEENYDVIYVEYTIDNGVNWQVLGSANDPNWYNSDFSGNQLTIGSQWTGTDATLKEYKHDLMFLQNQSNVIFRFKFLSDDFVVQEGVVIDYFVISEFNTNAVNDVIFSKISIYPNPSTGIFTIKNNTNSNVAFEIYDITGKTVIATKQISTQLHHLDLSNYATGIYFMKLKVNDKSMVKKLIIN